jgi:hypothetical protein
MPLPFIKGLKMPILSFILLTPQPVLFWDHSLQLGSSRVDLIKTNPPVNDTVKKVQRRDL